MKNATQQAVVTADEAVRRKNDDAELTAQGEKGQYMGESRQLVEKAKDERA